APMAPGTWGSLLGTILAWPLASLGGAPALVAAALVIFVVGCWAAERVARESGIADPGFVVIDEVAAQILVLAVAPRSLLAYGVGFLLFRAADIVKPWPVSWIDRRFHNGVGIMADDLAAAIYAGVAFVLLLKFIS